MNEIKDAVRQFILATALPGESPNNLRDNTPLQTSGILDSLAVLGLVSFVERTFDVELDLVDTAVDRFDNLDQIARTVSRKRATRQATTGAA